MHEFRDTLYFQEINKINSKIFEKIITLVSLHWRAKGFSLEINLIFF
jgi:hypothetical protein